MNIWYIEKDGAQLGPVAEVEILDRVAAGEITRQTLLWRDGMETWAPAGQISSLSGAFAAPIPSAAVSPYSPPTSEAAAVELPIVSSGPQVRPWIRYWARTFDTVVFVIVFGFTLGFLLPQILEIHDTVFNMIALAAMAFYEAACLSIFSTTPGKALFRIRICRRDGTPPSFGMALLRSFRVFIKGVGLGIPLIALITQIVGYQTLNRDGITSWDKQADLIVTHREIPTWLGVVIFLAFIGILGLFGFLAYLGAEI